MGFSSNRAKVRLCAMGDEALCNATVRKAGYGVEGGEGKHSTTRRSVSFQMTAQEQTLNKTPKWSKESTEGYHVIGREESSEAPRRVFDVDKLEARISRVTTLYSPRDTEHRRTGTADLRRGLDGKGSDAEGV